MMGKVRKLADPDERTASVANFSVGLGPAALATRVSCGILGAAGAACWPAGINMD